MNREFKIAVYKRKELGIMMLLSVLLTYLKYVQHTDGHMELNYVEFVEGIQKCKYDGHSERKFDSLKIFLL